MMSGQMTDAVPITETDMVGDILQDQEEEEREQYDPCRCQHGGRGISRS